MTTPQVGRGLGSRFLQGSQDGTAATGGEQINPYLPGTGWDVTFQPADLGVPQSEEWECYHIALDGPVGSAVTVMIDRKIWDYALGWSNGWDPSEPMLLRAGVSVQFCWNAAFTNPPYNRTNNIRPQVTLWLRRGSEVF